MEAMKVSKRLKAGTLLLRNEFEGVTIRNKPGTAIFYAKFPGQPEYKVHYSSKLVTDALLAA